jgi:hypothetical protein
MISATSRYANSTVIPGSDLDGNDIMVIIFSTPTDTTFQFTYYQVNGADEVSALAQRFYGDATLWWVLANANPEVLDWTTLVAGTLLRIPTLASALL